jgi:hypothetical protein
MIVAASALAAGAPTARIGDRGEVARLSSRPKWRPSTE